MKKLEKLSFFLSHWTLDGWTIKALDIDAEETEEAQWKNWRSQESSDRAAEGEMA